MVSVIASCVAQQTLDYSGPSGVLRAPLPALGSGDWYEVPGLNNSQVIIGQDDHSVYFTPRHDSSALDAVVFRADLATGAVDEIAGSLVGRYYGKVRLALSLGGRDAILFGYSAIARIHEDEELWRINITGQSGYTMADSAGKSGGSVTAIYQRADFSNFRPFDYRTFTFSVETPPSTSSMATWPLIGVDWETLEAKEQWDIPSPAVLAAALPGLEFGSAMSHVRSSDGWFVIGCSVLTDTFDDGGIAATTYYDNLYNYPDTFLARTTAGVTISGGVVVDVSVETTTLGKTVSDIPLPALIPPYDTWQVGSRFEFSISHEAPQPPEAFWTNLRRAVEVV